MGIPAASLCVAIVSTFTGIASLLHAKATRKEASLRYEANKSEAQAGNDKDKEELDKSVALGPPVIQGTYDKNFSMIGPRFAEGDGT